jgi:tetratricopeptide (TPR) repeat protein
MKKILFIAASGLLLVVLLATGVSVYSRNNYLSGQLGQLNKMVQKAQEELSSMQSEREKTLKENERLQNDSVSYLAVNTKLQEEKDLLQKNFEEAQRLIGVKEDSLQRIQGQLDKVQNELKKRGPSSQAFAKAQEKKLKLGVFILQKRITLERAVYNYNLGVAYTQAKLYDEAIAAYRKSLEFNPANPEAQYNLAIIYDRIQEDRENAGRHYRQYLKLKPGAEDKDEVLSRIEDLSK